MNRVLMVFLDGVGLGPSDPLTNPLAAPWTGLAAYSGGSQWVAGTEENAPGMLFRGIDACLGLEGLPQSGTGQATLFTGVNCAALAGRHYGPYPHSATRQALREQSIFARIGAEDAAFANAYPPRFFDWVKRTGRWPVTTRACLDADIRIRTLEDLEDGNGIAADVSGQGLHAMGLDVSVVSAAEAASRLIGISARRRFTMFEVFHTDKAGHAQSDDQAAAILANVDALLAALAESRPDNLTIVISSDHGNVEDLTTRSHTRNPVPLAVLGDGSAAFSEARDLTHVTPAILEVLA